MEAPKGRSVRDCMPEVYAWLESLRHGFGRETINSAIASGLTGQTHLWLKEGAYEIGKPGPEGVPLATLHTIGKP